MRPAEAGARVSLISGPVHLATPTNVKRINVETAQQMHNEVMVQLENCDLFIACAAVSDFSPSKVSSHKIKKTENNVLQLILQPTVDIVSSVTEIDCPPFVVGFAAETEAIENYAKDKLQRKKLDMIAANRVGEGVGFAVDDNELQVFWDEDSHILPLASKSQIARDLMILIIERYNAKNTT
ncbi:MAG: phosphopantothenoylcysteine decarboxylase [Gammaproteobacteria bacterium]|nr:phosphopantothenoylcysteine decarboxylase [Gammaproteobacteria bacterium]